MGLAPNISQSDQGDSSYANPVLSPDYPTFAGLFAAAAKTFPEQEAYVHGDDRLTYGEWYDQSLRMAGAFEELGVVAGDIVLIALEGSIDFAVCFGAAQLLGAIASGINIRLGRREIAAIVQKTGASLIVLEDDAEPPEGVPHIVRRSDLAEMRKGSRKAVPHEGKSSDISVIIWTSGTTGLPKGAQFDHDNLRAAVQTAGPMAAPYARRLNSTPFAHAGYMSKGWEQVAFALTLVISETPWKAERMLELLVGERINIAGAVPTQWAKLLELPDLPSADFSHLKCGITATSPAPPELVERVTKAIGAPLIARYSMTECPSMTGTRPGDSPEVLYRTVGRAQPGVELRIVDDHGNDVPPGEIGRISVRSPAVMRGYLNDPERTREALSEDGWLLTSDNARLDADGNVILEGRTGDMYIRGGYNVYPIEVERILTELPGVKSAAVVGKPAPTIGDIGVAFVVPENAESPPDLPGVRAAVQAELADYKAPDALVVVESLPMTAMMKVDKVALRKWAAELDTSYARR